MAPLFAGLRPGTLLFFATLWVVRFFWQCLLGGRLGPPFFPAGKESAAGGVKKGGQGGLPMGPLDDPPTANKGGCGPLFWINSPGEHEGSAVRVRRRRERELFHFAAGQSAALLPVLGWKLVLRWGSSGEHGKGFLVFELRGLLALVLRQRVTNLECYSGEQGRRSSLRKRTFVCN